jgi:hypothetical protein
MAPSRSFRNQPDGTVKGFVVSLFGGAEGVLAWWSRRVVRWSFALVVVPLAAWSLGWVADQLAQRQGENRLTALLRLPQRLRSH